jgi:hypothetical protein
MPERPPRPPPTEDPEANLPFAERWIAPFFREPMLWPVGIVLIAHAVAFLAPVLLFSVRDRKLGALAALALLLVMSGSAARAGKPPRSVSAPAWSAACSRPPGFLSVATAVLARTEAGDQPDPYRPIQVPERAQAFLVFVEPLGAERE